jgi:hypothetical protein
MIESDEDYGVPVGQSGSNLNRNKFNMERNNNNNVMSPPNMPTSSPPTTTFTRNPNFSANSRRNDDGNRSFTR